MSEPSAAAQGSKTPPISIQAEPPRIRYFGDYELLEEIARGGMGVVYKARQVSLNRLVAVKMILSGQLASDAEVKRFQAEAEAAANLQHPNIVAIHEVGQHEGQHYFSMDYVEGQNLAAIARETPFLPPQVAQLVQTVAEAVHYAHQRGTLHRDLKPQNILLDATGRPRITDFGLAKRIHQASDATQTGVGMGTPAYMAPEQAGGQWDRVGPVSDVYSLGAILYELLTGRPPFQGESPMVTLAKVIEEEPPPLRRINPRVPEELEIITLKCLEKAVERRYPNARALAEELERFLHNEPILAKPAGPVRKTWIWARRHPWAVTGLLSALFFASIGFTFGLLEQVRFLKWKVGHPGQTAPFSPRDFISQPFALFLLIEFFFLQSWPLLSFLQHRLRGLPRRTIGCYLAMGVAQILLGIYLVFQGVSAAIWVRGYWSQFALLVLTPALSNGWFGSLLIWWCLGEFRKASAGTDIKAEPIAPTAWIGNPKAALKVLFVQTAAVCLIAYRQNSSNDMLAGYILGSLGVTLLIPLAAALRRSGGVASSAFFPPLILISGLSLGAFILPLSRLAECLLLGLVNGLILAKAAHLKEGQFAGSPQSTQSMASDWRRKQVLLTARVMAGLLLLIGLVLFWERKRGHDALEAWKAETTSTGRRVNLPRLWPPPLESDRDFVNRFRAASKKLPEGPIPVGTVSGMILTKPGEAFLACRSSELPSLGATRTNSWDDLDQQLQSASNVLSEIRDLLRNPASSQGLDYQKVFNLGVFPWNYVANRLVAQWLNVNALNELRKGNRQAALRDLVALAGMTRLFERDPILVNQMIRVAIIGLAMGTVWEAVQLPDWTEAQLAEMQGAWEQPELIEQLYRTFQSEFEFGLFTYEQLRSSSYGRWEQRMLQLYSDLALRADPGLVPQRAWRQMVFHPLWRFAWSEQEALTYARHTQLDLDAYAWGVVHRSWTGLRDRLQAHHESYEPPLFSFRFYFGAPLLTGLTAFGKVDLLSGFGPADYPYGNFKMAWRAAMRNLTLRELAVAAIALKRYEMRHGKPAPNLSALIPDFLAKAPLDLMDGNPIRYHAFTDGRAVLYSVGQDGSDNGGDPSPSRENQNESGIWSGRDALWPRAVP